MRINSLNSKRIVIVGVALAAVVIVFIAGKNTFQVAVKYTTLKKQLTTLNTGNPNGVNQKVEQNKFLLQEIDLEREVFSTVSQSCQKNQVNLKQVQSPQISNDGKIIVLTQRVTLQGDFVKILKSLQDIQTEMSTIKISSLKFEIEEVNKVQTLLAHIYFQGVKHLQESDE
jgi:hypothetical protein